jgi:hypothetical protein
MDIAQHSDAARSAARFLLTRARYLRHSEAVADCLHCNVLFLAKWALATLESPQSLDAVDPQATDPGTLTTRD